MRLRRVQGGTVTNRQRATGSRPPAARRRLCGERGERQRVHIRAADGRTNGRVYGGYPYGVRLSVIKVRARSELVVVMSRCIARIFGEEDRTLG